MKRTIETQGWSVEPDPLPMREGEIVTLEGVPVRFRVMTVETHDGITAAKLVAIPAVEHDAS